MGWGRGANVYGDTAWTNDQQFQIDGIVASGLRNFYYPSSVDGQPSSYDWSFLHPTATADFPVSAQSINLPDDFGGFEGQITLLTVTSTAQPWCIQWRNEGSIREMYACTPSMSGPPMFACQMAVKGTTGTAGQRFKLLVFPGADQDYTLQFQYYINPDYLSGAFPYAYGGAQHSETILESCLAVAEVRLDDAMSVHSAKFRERLQASVSVDRRNKPAKIGQNLDRSDWVYGQRINPHIWAGPATYNGQGFG
jgi:hypothetical protein